MSETQDQAKRNVVDWIVDRLPETLSKRLTDRAINYEIDRQWNREDISTGEGKLPDNLLTRSDWFKQAKATAEQLMDAEVERLTHHSRDFTQWGTVTHVKNSDMERVSYSADLMNYSLGKSEKGYHYALNEFFMSGPDREGNWSEPFPTIEDAEKFARLDLIDRTEDTRDYEALSQKSTPKETRLAEWAEADEYHDPDRLIADWLKPAAERVELGIETPQREDRLSDLQQQQQQTRDYVKEMVERPQEVEQEMPKERKQERDQGRER